MHCSGYIRASMATDHAQVISVRLDGTNYAYRAHLMTNTLKGRKLWKYVSIKVEKPTDPTKEGVGI